MTHRVERNPCGYYMASRWQEKHRINLDNLRDMSEQTDEGACISKTNTGCKRVVLAKINVKYCKET